MPPQPFRPLSRRSGRIPALPYPPLRYYQSGSHLPRRSMLLQRTATTPLTSCLTPGVHFILPLRFHSVNGRLAWGISEVADFVGPELTTVNAFVLYFQSTLRFPSWTSHVCFWQGCVGYKKVDSKSDSI